MECITCIKMTLSNKEQYDKRLGSRSKSMPVNSLTERVGGDSPPLLFIINYDIGQNQHFQSRTFLYKCKNVPVLRY